MSALELRPACFELRHIGPNAADQMAMLAELGLGSLEQLAAEVVPADILLPPEAAEQGLPQPCGEAEALAELAAIAGQNRVLRSLIGQGYYGTATPALIQRHVLENPCWYTAYTPYQAEIAQGRLEALLNFQTLVSELTGLPIANASLLDEATAAAEAMALARAVCRRPGASRLLVDDQVFPQTLAVLATRAEPLGIVVEPVAVEQLKAFPSDAFGLLVQLPGRRGGLWDPQPLLQAASAAGLVTVVAVDPLAQVLLAPVAELGADIAVGSAQRFGVPMGGGGPHAAFFATREAFKRQIPGRLVGRSLDAEGRPALRLALQTREQHIRRDKATSNICTAQVLLAVMAGFYAVHHGPEGLTAMARRIRALRQALVAGLDALGLPLLQGPGFGTVWLPLPAVPAAAAQAAALAAGFNLHRSDDGIGISLDELSTAAEVQRLLHALAAGDAAAALRAQEACGHALAEAEAAAEAAWAAAGLPPRQAPWLQQEPFQRYRSETELLRYIQPVSYTHLTLPTKA